MASVVRFRLLLLVALISPALHCADEDGTPACSDCACLDRPDGPLPDDDDSSGMQGDDDDSADIDPTAELAACEGGVLAAFTFEEIDPPAAGSEGYYPPTGDTIEAIETSVLTLMAGEPVLAASEAAVVGYELCRGQDAEAGTALWRPVAHGSGRAVFAWRAVGARPLIIGVPHPNFELHTLQEGLEMFEELNARALIVSGTHRCASTTEGSCDGTTEVCGTESPYPVSDMAHTEESVYQLAHELVSDAFEQDWVLSLHGMSQEGISISNGTTEATDLDSPEALFGTQLLLNLPPDDISSCNDWEGMAVDLRLCGTTNVQGRYINGSAEPCSVEASSSARRFIHLEQSLAVREQYGEVIAALDAVLPAAEVN